ncbi:MAG: ankyrin repeat domain-containing protein [Acidobacteriota bacterium]
MPMMHGTRRGGWVVLALLLGLSVVAAGRAVLADTASLVEAVKSGNATLARALLAKQADVNVAEADGTTALHWAAELDDLPMARALLKAGAKAQLANRYGVTPLHLAATNGNAAMIEQLLSAGADPNAVLPEGETVLMTAARTGNADAVKALVGGGANVNAKEARKGQTPLMWAAAENRAAAIRVLAAAGADIHASSTGKFTPLLFAVRGGHIDATRALLDAGADVNERMADGMSTLVLALYNAHFELAGFLLDRGADPNAAAQGWAALHQLAWSRRPNRGFNLPGAVPTGSLDSLELVKKLVAHGANVNARMTREPRDGNRNMMNRLGSTPFIMAAKTADVPLMRALLDNGADPKLKSTDGTSAIMVAAGVGVYGSGESPGTHEEALAAVQLAYEVGGGDVNDANKDGETALHGAVYRGGAVPVIQFLADKGATLDVYNKKRWTPLFAAEGVVYASSGIRRYPEAAALLRKLMLDRGIQADQSGRITNLSAPAASSTARSADTTPAGARTNWDGVYSDEQAARGKQVYTRACAVCHLDTLQGDSVSPTLVGPSFFARFPDATALDMVSAIRSSMPQNAPDSLGDQAYVDLVSYLLKVNGNRSGQAELKTDVAELEKIIIRDQPGTK